MRMTKLVRNTAAAAICAVPLPAALADVVETRELRERFEVGAAPTVVVDNVFGAIRVVGHDARTVELKATETIRGDLQSDIERARAAVQLRIDRDAGGVAFRVRHAGADDSQCSCGRWEDYTVEYQMELSVPRDAVLDLSMVNGDIDAGGVGGDFEISNVNGEVRLAGLRGSGSVKTVNGALAAVFERAPPRASSFSTVNGDIEVTFPGGLDADLRFTTLRGDIYTDFDTRPLAVEPARGPERERGARPRGQRAWAGALRMGGDTGVRIGAGGPQHSFKTVNGEIRIRKGAP